MKNFLLMGRGMNMIPLAVEIFRQEQLWREDTYLRDYPQGPFKDVETIFLRFPPSSVSELERDAKDQHECVWMDGALHLSAARPLIFALMSQVQGERLGRVMLNRIRPGGRIYPHADTPAHAQYWDRFHYVVQSSPGCVFRCGEERVAMQTGELWWFQNALEHEVQNGSASERIHLIIDVRTAHFSVKGTLPTSEPQERP
jgi:hypothetical protein